MKKIAYELFHNQIDMSDKLNMTTSKTAMVVNGQQRLTIEAIDILINDFNIDPMWLFRGEDSEPIKFSTSKTEDKKNYYEVVEKLSLVQEELLEYKNKEISKHN